MIDSDTTQNVVIFIIKMDGKLVERLARGTTRSNNCIRQVWDALCLMEQLRAKCVYQIYSEWEPSAKDKAFIDATFQRNCVVEFTYKRPTSSEGWDKALLKAKKKMIQKHFEETGEVVDDSPPIEGVALNDSVDDLFPVLRTYHAGTDVFAESVVNRGLGAGLGFFLGHVNWTPHKTVGTAYVMKGEVEAFGKSAEELMDIACRNLEKELQVIPYEVDGERAFLLKHPMDMGASAIGLPGFYQNACQMAEAEKLFVGFADPGMLFLTSSKNKLAASRLGKTILKSNYWGSVYLTPACYLLTAKGLKLIAARPAPKE
ncbi:MAG TPA: hypothetical protein PLN21_15505 [Gemmatales bacterium]|nr:hypothetical protein [Gemmatales bacterium]